STLTDERCEPYLNVGLVSEILNRAGQVEKAANPTLLAYNVRLGNYQAATGHNIADIFWRYMNASGPVEVNGGLLNGPVFDWLATLGYPITEPYWVRAPVHGQERWLLVQAFQ